MYRRTLPIHCVLFLLALAMGCKHGGFVASNVPSVIRISCGGCTQLTPQSPVYLDLTEATDPTPTEGNEATVASLTASVLNNSGNSVLPQPTVTWLTSDASAVTVSPGGSVCPGTWDLNFVVCRPGTIPTSPVTVTATTGGAAASIYVTIHSQIDRIQLSASPTTATSPIACLSQNQTQQFTATAYSNGVDVTKQVAAFTWSLSDSSIGDINFAGLAIARAPGISYVIASAGGVNSAPLALVVCPIASIRLTQQGTANTSFSMNRGTQVTLVAAMTDSAGNAVNGIPLTFDSSDPASAGVGSQGGTAAVLSAIGSTSFSVLASCAPPACNNAPAGTVYTPSGAANSAALGFTYPIYSNLVQGSIVGTTPTTVYVTGSQYPDGHTNHELQVLDSQTLSFQTSITLPFVPNSILFDPKGQTAYIGSNDGTLGNSIMVLNASSNGVTIFSGAISGIPNAGTITGNVLALSPDGGTLIVSNQSDGDLYVVNTPKSTASAFYAPGIQSASFSPDGYQVVLAGPGGVYVYSTLLGTLTNLGPGATSLGSEVAYLPEATMAYVSGAGLTAYATCNNRAIAQTAVAAGPLAALLPATGPRVVGVSNTSWVDLSVPVTGGSCPSSANSALITVPYGACPPTQIAAAPNGSAVFVTAVDPASCASASTIPMYNLLTATAGSINLQTPGVPVAGGISRDGANLYVALANGNSPTLHRIDLTVGSDTTHINIPFIPNVFAVLPK